MRLQKYMAMMGIASRRKCERLIEQGKVTVNSVTVTEMGFQIDPDKDIITFNNKRIAGKPLRRTFLLYKPIGVISSASDPYGRTTVVEMLPRNERLYPVGRLDYLTSGAILLTNDGELALQLTHPRYETQKTYHAWLKGTIDREAMESFEKGIHIDDFVTSPADIKILKKGNNRCLVEIILREGRNRQIRKMCDALGYPVMRLKRVAIGSITLGELKPGEWRELSGNEIKQLLKDSMK